MNSLTNKFIIFFLLLFNTLFGQVNLDWVRRYSGPGSFEDSGNSIFVDDSEKVYVTGGVQISSGYLGTTIKYSKYGDSLWVRNYQRAGNNYNQFFDIKVDDSGNVFIVGAQSIIKYNRVGDLIWTRYDSTELIKIILDSNEKIYAGGTGGGYFVVVKYDKNGNREWKIKYPGAYKMQDMTLDMSGNIIFTGEGQHTGTYYDYNTFKYSNNGNFRWVRIYNGTGPPPTAMDNPYAVIADISGNVYVTGASQNDMSVFNNVTIKYDSLGNTIWVKRIYPPTNGYDIAVDENQNVYISSRSSGNNFTTKLDIDGNVVWMRVYPTTNGFATNKSVIILDSINNVYVTANIDSNSYTRYGAIKYDNNGNQIFVVSYRNTASSFNYVYDMAVDKKGNFYLTGTSQGTGSYYDYATVKYSSLITNISGSNISLLSYKLEQNYPNPFNPSTKIEYELPVEEYVSILVYDITGKLIQTLVNENKSAGKYEVTFDGSNFASGIYYYKIESGNFSQVRKMILIK